MAKVKITSNKYKILREINVNIPLALEKCGSVAERYAKAKCPVDTGRLRNSLTHEVDMSQGAVFIGTNVVYGPYVELGTKRQRAQPYLKPAVVDHMDEYKRILNDYLGS